MKLCIWTLALLGLAAPPLGGAYGQTPIPNRTPLSVIPVSPGKAVSRVETTRVDFQPGQIMPMHKHTVPVVCFVSKGDFLVKIGDAAEQRISQGATTYEPAQVVVRYFKNASLTKPAQLLCASLAGADDKVLNVMLDPDR